MPCSKTVHKKHAPWMLTMERGPQMTMPVASIEIDHEKRMFIVKSSWKKAPKLEPTWVVLSSRHSSDRRKPANSKLQDLDPQTRFSIQNLQQNIQRSTPKILSSPHPVVSDFNSKGNNQNNYKCIVYIYMCTAYVCKQHAFHIPTPKPTHQETENMHSST